MSNYNYGSNVTAVNFSDYNRRVRRDARSLEIVAKNTSIRKARKRALVRKTSISLVKFLAWIGVFTIFSILFFNLGLKEHPTTDFNSRFLTSIIQSFFAIFLIFILKSQFKNIFSYFIEIFSAKTDEEIKSISRKYL